MREFARLVISWQLESGRHGLPWQQTRDPYARWVAEIMLQQTRVSSVIPFYERFLQDYPDIHALARASDEDVLSHWAGLGYYSRARNLHACARAVSKSGGVFPNNAEDLCRLPGIGRSTAGAILSGCWDIPAPIMDGNARRVFCRYFGIRREGSETELEKRLWQKAEEELPASQCAVYAQGLMDLGSEVCMRTRPKCEKCPLARNCEGLRAGSPDSFPGKKPSSRKKKEQTVRFLLIRNTTGVWLSRRDGAEVWRGLWCLPRLSECERAFEDMLSSGVLEGGEAWGMMRHEFTHYTLHMDVRKATALASDLSKWIPGKWFSSAQLALGAVPTPVKRIGLQELGEELGG